MKAVIAVRPGERFARVVEGSDYLEKRLGVRGPLLRVEDALIAVIEGVAEAYTEDGRRLSVEELASIANRVNPSAWLVVEVYSDLRRRGRIAVPGPRENTLLVKLSRRQRDYSYYVLVLEERRPVSLRLILSFIEEARKNGWEPLLAIVDAYGDVTYYTPSLFTPQRGRGGGKGTP